METYLTTHEETLEAAKQSKSKYLETYIKEGSYRCACGESFACYLIDKKTLNTLEIFVYCESCHHEN